MVQHSISSDDVRLGVYETGNPRGHAVLFIHGWSQGALAWQRQLTDPALADRLRLVALDLRGHGASDKPAGGYDDSKRWAADIGAVIEGLSLRDVTLVGWSYGGYVICDYVRAFGESELRGLVFAGASTDMGGSVPYRSARAPGWDGLLPAGDSDRPHVFSRDAEPAAEAILEFVRRMTRAPLDPLMQHALLGTAMQTPPRVREALFRRTLRNDDVLERLSVPALVAYGVHDTLVDPKTSLHIADKIRNATLSRYDNSAHAPFLEEHERFNRELVGFC